MRDPIRFLPAFAGLAILGACAAGETPTAPTAAPVSSVAVTPGEVRLAPQETFQLTATPRDASGNALPNRPVTWATSSAGVATVSVTGLVTAVAPGTAEITATSEGRSGSAIVTAAIPVASVTIDPTAATMVPAQTVQLIATARDPSGNALSNRAITWTTGASAVATVDASGLVTAKAPGLVTITASSEGRIGTTTITVTDACLGLNATDCATLSRHLEILSSGWVQSSVDSANAYLLNPGAYSQAGWEAFFRSFFTGHPFTADLNNYLGYPVLHWGTPASYGRIQPALQAALQATMRNVLAQFASNPTQRNAEKLLYSNGVLVQIANRGVRPASADEVFAFEKELASAYPQYFVQPVQMAGDSWLGAIRRNVHLALATAKPLSPATKEEIVAVLGLSGVRASILRDHSVLLIDNGGLDASQLAAVELQLRLTPPPLRAMLVAISVNDFLGAKALQTISFVPNKYDVNIFGNRLTEYPGNQFPDDVASWTVPLFVSALAHEVNHVVDAGYVDTQPVLRARRNALIQAAGNDHLNYLRSMLPDGFFVSAPQEFFASISNQWMTNSDRTLQLGRVRFDAGRREPMNQAVFFAEVYSLGGGTTAMYEVSASGAITRRDAPLTRDGNGHIASLTTSTTRYTFVRDASGNVTSYTAQPNP